MHLVPHDLNIDFIGKRKLAALLSTLMVLASIALFVFVGPTWGIDFTGGTEVRIKFSEDTDIGDVRDALAELELGSDAVQQYGPAEDDEFTIRVQDATFGADEMQSQAKAALAAAFGPDWMVESSYDAQVGARLTVRYAGPVVPLSEIEKAVSGMQGARAREALEDNTVYVELPGLTSKISHAIEEQLQGRAFEVRNVDSVGPKVGDELKTQGFIAMFATLALMLLYIGFRFEAAFAPGAIVALFHDVTITVGVFILLDLVGWKHEFNLSMIGALLTIIGTSINDTIVTYDRIRENKQRYRRKDTAVLINNSINETLGRTLATNFTMFLSLMAFLVLGGDVIETFALAMMIGIIVGTYSTIYIASPSILLMEDLMPYVDRIFRPGGAARETAAPAAPAGGPAPALTASEQRRREREARRRGEGGDEG